MKTYQDADPLHGNGKAVPKPKRPTHSTKRIVVNRYTGNIRHEWEITRVVIGPHTLTRNGNPARPWPAPMGGRGL